MDDSADWCVECSDDEDKYGLEGRWEPPAEEIVKLYTALAHGREMILDWQCPGRRLPQTGKKSKPMNLHENAEKSQKSPTKEQPASPSGYEFDVDEASAPVTPSRVTRIPGKTPKSAQKRVARFDRVINDINRQKLGSPVASPDSPAGMGATTTTATTTAAVTTSAVTTSTPTPSSPTNSTHPPARSLPQQLQQMKLPSSPGGTTHNQTSSPSPQPANSVS